MDADEDDEEDGDEEREEDVDEGSIMEEGPLDEEVFCFCIVYTQRSTLKTKTEI